MKAISGKAFAKLLEKKGWELMKASCDMMQSDKQGLLFPALHFCLCPNEALQAAAAMQKGQYYPGNSKRIRRKIVDTGF